MSAQVMRRVRRAIAPAAIGGAAVVTIAAVGGVAVVSPDAVASTMHDLTALIIDGSSTDAASKSIEDFYQRTFTAGRDAIVTIDFYTGPLDLQPARAADVSGADTAVVTPGAGAADARSLLTSPESPANPEVRVVEENVARFDGGDDSQNPVLPAAETDATPTSTSTGTDVVDVGYEYDLSDNAPAYVLNGISWANSVMAHLDPRTDPAPEDPPARVQQVGQITYVFYESTDLPLTRPLRRYGGPAGERLADAIEPALRTVVDYGYSDNDPLASPGDREPARLVPTARETREFAEGFSVAVREGIDSLAKSDDSRRGRNERNTDAHSSDDGSPSSASAGVAPR